MTDVAHVDARLNSLFAPGFTPEERVLMDAKGLTPTAGVLPEAPGVKILNGRELQGRAQTDASFTEAGFFEEHSFVLLDHVSNVQDWDSDPAVSPQDTDIARIYYPEIATVIRERLLPGYRLEIPQSTVPATPGSGNAQPVLRHRRPSRTTA